jgi:hypothetical protein
MFRIAIVYVKMIVLGSLASAALLSCNSSAGQKLAREAADPIATTAGVDTYFTLVDSAEFAGYKHEAEIKLKENELLIAEMKDRLISGQEESSHTYVQQLDSLSMRNSKLRKTMKMYNSEGRIKWESFKRHFKGELDAIGRSIYLLDEQI